MWKAMTTVKALVRILETMVCIALGLYAIATANEIRQNEEQKLMIEIYPTFGPYGAIRRPEYLPGEQLYFCYKIAGLRLDSNKRMNASVEFALFHDKEGFLCDAGGVDLNGPLSFGRDLACFEWARFLNRKSNVALPIHASAGGYHLEMTVVDHLTGRKQTKRFAFKVLPKGTFGAISLQLSSDPDAEFPVGSHPSVGQTAFLTFGLVGHAVVDGRMQVRVSMRKKKREDGGLVSLEHEEFVVDEAADAERIAAGGATRLNYGLFLNRPGRFLLELEIEDLLSKKGRKASYTIPLVVVAPWEDAMNVPKDGESQSNTKVEQKR